MSQEWCHERGGRSVPATCACNTCLQGLMVKIGRLLAQHGIRPSVVLAGFRARPDDDRDQARPPAAPCRLVESVSTVG